VSTIVRITGLVTKGKEVLTGIARAAGLGIEPHGSTGSRGGHGGRGRGRGGRPSPLPPPDRYGDYHFNFKNVLEKETFVSQCRTHMIDGLSLFDVQPGMLDDSQVELRLLVTRKDSLRLPGKSAELRTKHGHALLEAIDTDLRQVAQLAISDCDDKASMTVKTCKMNRNRNLSYLHKGTWSSYDGRNVAIMWIGAGLDRQDIMDAVTKAIEAHEWNENGVSVKLEVSPDLVYFARLPAPTGTAVRILNVPAGVDKTNASAFFAELNIAFSKRGLKTGDQNKPISAVGLNVGPDVTENTCPSQQQGQGTGLLFFHDPSAVHMLVRSENTDVRVPWEGKHYIVSFKLLSTMEKKLVDEQHSGAPPPSPLNRDEQSGAPPPPSSQP
jgi:hypothetical protein